MDKKEYIIYWVDAAGKYQVDTAKSREAVARMVYSTNSARRKSVVMAVYKGNQCSLEDLYVEGEIATKVIKNA